MSSNFQRNAVALAAVALFVSIAHAENTVEDSSTDTVVVTGTVGKKTKTQTSYSITTMDSEFVRLQGPTSVTETMKSVPGFWVEASGGEASGNIRARGVPVDGFGSIQLLEDGMPVQHDPALGYLNADQVFRLDETIGKVEVVRGGPSTILYSNAPAGAINFISKDVSSKAEGTVKVRLSNHNERRVDVWYSQPVSEDMGIGLGGFYRVDPGVRNPGFDANKGGQFRFKLVKDIEQGTLSADYKHIDDKVELYLGLPMQVYSGGKLGGVPGLNANYATLAGPQTTHVNLTTGSGGTYNFDNTDGTYVKRDQLTLGLEKSLGDNWNLKDSFRYNDTQTIRNGVFPNSLISTTNLLAQATTSGLLKYVPGATTLGVQYTKAPGTTYTGNGLVVVAGLRGITMPLQETMNDLRLTKKFEVAGQEHNLTVGDYVGAFSQGFQRFSSSALVGAQSQGPLLDIVGLNAAGSSVGTVTSNGIYQNGYEWANAHGKSFTNALYLDDDWHITDKLSVDAGVRMESVHVSGWNEQAKFVNLGSFSTSNIKTGNGVIDTYSHTFNKTGWSIGSNYQVSKNSGYFARWSQAYRLPNLSNYITSPNPTPTPPVQTMDLGEVGYKFTSADLDLFPTVFYTKYNNVAMTNYVFTLNNAAATPQYLFADTKTLGLELDGDYRFTKWADLGFVATVEQPKYGNFVYTNSANQVVNYQNNQLIRVPKMDYRLVPGVDLMEGKLRLQLAYEWVGKRFVDAANTVVLPSYNVTNFASRYQFDKKTSFYFNVDNMFNSQGLTEGNPRAGEVVSADAGANAFIARPIMGRNVRLSMKYDF